MTPTSGSPVSVAVVGATGYGGAELVSLLGNHPYFSPDYLTSDSFSGRSFSEVYPRFKGQVDQSCEPLETERLDNYELVFFALPHGKSMEIVGSLDPGETKVVDLAADYRFDSVRTFRRVYDSEHADPEGLDRSVFGLSEYFTDEIAQTDLVACPGCYVTASLVPLYPILRDGPSLESFFIDAKSGVSGAGRKPSSSNTFVNCNETIQPYDVVSHRHSVEIEQHVRTFSESAEFSFAPHVTAMDHGIEAAIYMVFENSEQAKSIPGLLRSVCNRHELFRYQEEPEGVKPVVKSPYCDLTAIPDGNRVIVFSYLDNLWKGAASQAIQNANLLFGYPMSEGLTGC